MTYRVGRGPQAPLPTPASLDGAVQGPQAPQRRVGQQEPVIATNPVATPVKTSPRVWLDLGSIGQRIQSAFQSVARPALAPVLGALMLMGQPALAQAQERAPVGGAATISATSPLQADRFEAGRLTEYPLFRMFWNAPSTAAEGLTNQGEFELSEAGVAKLKAYAETHDLSGRSTSRGGISESERELITALIHHPHYGAFIDPAARPQLQAAFGLPVEQVQATVGVAPQKAGDVAIPRGVSRYSATELRGPLVQNLGTQLAAEYASRRDFFEDPAASPEEKSRRVLGLFADYASAVQFHGSVDFAEAGLESLMREVRRTPFWSVLGAQDFNGAGWNVLESLALGLDANSFRIQFPEATSSPNVTYFSMNGALAGPMRAVDDYREALGLERRASQFESRSVLGFIVGEESGHTKLSPLDERQPFATSGVNWGRLLFPNDAEIAGLKPRPGFEFPIDAIDAYGIAFNNNPAWGDRIVVVDADKRPLRVEREIQRGADGKAESWSAKFFDAANQEVAPDRVLGLIQNSSGRTKGDGQASAQLNMSYWGFCNVNTAQGVYKPSYGIPQLDRASVPVEANGRIINFSREDAQKLLDSDVESLVPRNAYAGFRFTGEPQTIRLTDGSTLRGMIQDHEFLPGLNTVRESADIITVTATPESPFRGTVRLKDGGSDTRIDARNIVSVTEAGNGRVEVEYRYSSSSSYTTTAQGTLSTPVDFQGLPKNQAGKRVWTPQTGRPIVGEMTIKLNDGSTRTVSAAEVERITGETQSDTRPSLFVAYVSRMNGVYATDASRGASVSNGARYVNNIETVVERGGHRPQWAAGSLTGVFGPLVRQEDDRMMYRRGLAGDGSSARTAFAMWHQLDKTGQIINEGWISEEPDFLWGAVDPLAWNNRSVWNPHFPADLRVKLLVNGVADVEALAARAERLNLPANWRELRISDDRIPAPAPPPVAPAGTDGNAVAAPPR